MLKFNQVSISKEEIQEQLNNLVVSNQDKKYLRKNEKEMNISQKRRFIESVNELINSGWYNDFVNIHGDMTHNMHTCNMMTGQCTLLGAYRFLAWHRVYLLKIEQKLKEIDKKNFIPYWKWSENKRFPTWLADLLPKNLINRNGEIYSVERKLEKPSSELPSKEDIKSRLSIKNYREFTLAIEGTQPFGAHNAVHMWVDGTMATMYSPADPIFWLHHAECDRLWYLWQMKNPDQHPPLLGSDAIMDPWNLKYKDVSNIGELDYEYSDLKI